MPYSERKIITRQMLREEPDTLFVFGDNLARAGFGGQAAAMRGEPNAVGIPTKRRPDMFSFFCDADFDEVAPIIKQEFLKLEVHVIWNGDNVVWPADGIGTGLAQLQKRAPKIWDFIELNRKKLASC